LCVETSVPTMPATPSMAQRQCRTSASWKLCAQKRTKRGKVRREDVYVSGFQ